MMKATWLAAAVSIAAGCSTDDDGGNDGDGSGGFALGSSGGFVNGSGGAGSGGAPGTGGASSTGGGDTGGMSGDGGSDTGGMSGDGGSDTGGMSGDGGSDAGGAANLGGMGGNDSGPTFPSVGCSGCAILHVPFTAFDTGTDFEIDFGAGSLVDMTSTVVTVRLQVVLAGNTGGFQLFAKNGENQGYASSYFGWNNFTDADDGFVELEMDLAALGDPQGNFSKSEVRYVGINVSAGGQWGGAVLDDVYVFVDSITFSDAATADITFGQGYEPLAVNAFNSPVAGSQLGHE